MRTELTSADLAAARETIVGQLAGLPRDRQRSKAQEIAERLGTDEETLAEVLDGKQAPSPALAYRLQLYGIFGDLPAEEPREDGPKEAVSPFARLAGAGFLPDLLPIIPPDATLAEGTTVSDSDRGKVPGKFKAREKAWIGFKGWGSHETTQSDVERFARWPGVSVGIQTRRTPAVDIDVTDKSLAEAIEGAAVRVLGPAPRRVGKPPKRLLPYRCDAKLKKAALQFRHPETGAVHRVEVLGAGQQFVARGIHPGTGKPYRWEGGDLESIGRDGLTEITPEAVNSFLEEVARLMVAAGLEPAGGNAATADDSEKRPIGDPVLMGNPEKIKDALRCLGNDVADYTEWMRRVAAVKAALGGKEEHYPIYEEWCLLYPDNTPELARKKWDSVSHSSVGADYIADRAREAGWNGARWDFDPVPQGAAITEPVELAKDKRRLRITYLRDIKPEGRKRWLVDGVLDIGGMSIPYGASGEGKTFFATHVAVCIATGRPFYGRDVAQGGVLYIAAENPRSVKMRLLALKKHHGIGDNVPLGIIEQPVDLVHPQSDAQAVVDLVKDFERQTGTGIRLVVIDTLARTTAGADENSAKDMTAFVARCDGIRERTGAHIMVVHHSGKDESKGARGHSSLRAATDTEILIDNRTITITKQRDGEDGQKFAFDLEPVTIEGPEGSLDTVPVFREITAEEARRALHLEGRAKDAYEALQEALKDHGEPAPQGVGWGAPSGARIVSAKRWQAAFYERMPNSAPEVKRKTFDRAVRHLAKGRLISMTDEKQISCRFAWIIRAAASQEFEPPGGQNLFE
jgi:hypothetical protein